MSNDTPDPFPDKHTIEEIIELSKTNTQIYESSDGKFVFLGSVYNSEREFQISLKIWAIIMKPIIAFKKIKAFFSFKK